MKTLVPQIFTTSPLRIWGILAFFLLSTLNPLSAPSNPLMEKAVNNVNPIQRENQLPGTTDWQLSNPAPYDANTFHYPTIEGYAWTTSARLVMKCNFLSVQPHHLFLLISTVWGGIKGKAAD